MKEDDKYQEFVNRVNAPESPVEKLARQLGGMNDEGLKDFAAARAASPIAQPSKGQGKAKGDVNEAAGHILTRIYQGEIQFRKDGQQGISDRNFRELESFCQEHSSHLVPFDLLACSADIGHPPLDTLHKANDGISLAALNLEPLILQAPATAGPIMTWLCRALINIQRIAGIFGWSLDDLKLMARTIIDDDQKARKEKN